MGKRILKHVAWIVAILAVCLPPTFIATFLLTPLWSWIEATYGIESIGHSGPADWCFELIYGMLAAACILAYAIARRSSAPNGASK